MSLLSSVSSTVDSTSLLLRNVAGAEGNQVGCIYRAPAVLCCSSGPSDRTGVVALATMLATGWVKILDVGRSEIVSHC